MIIRLIITLILIYPIQSQNDDKPPPLPKFDLRDFNGTINGISLNNIDALIPEDNEKDILLLDHQIDEIKLRAKNFIPSPLTENDTILLLTNFGLLKFKLYHQESPINCLNFKKLSNSGFYDNTLLHQIVPKFIIQGGDILSRNYNSGDDGQGGPGWIINAEFNDLKHKRGTLSMVRSSSDSNSAGSQFFISLSENKNLDNQYTIIGQLIDGDHILSRIAKIPSENTQAKLLCRISIPEGEDEEEWIELKDPISNNNIYSKIPSSQDKISYTEDLEKMLNNLYKPGIPIIVDSIRVVNEKNIIK